MSDSTHALRNGDTIFEQVPTDLIHQCGTLLYLSLPDSMQQLNILLIDRLRINITHRRATISFADGLGIIKIILIGFYIGLDVARMDERYLMTMQFGNSGPVMRGGAGLEDYSALRRRCEKMFQLAAPKFQSGKNMAIAILRT